MYCRLSVVSDEIINPVFKMNDIILLSLVQAYNVAIEWWVVFERTDPLKVTALKLLSKKMCDK